MAKAWGLILLLAGAAPRPGDDELRDEAKRRFGVLPALPETAPSTPEARLGRALFWDARLSADGKTSCAGCHAAADGGADRRRFSPDARGKATTRNSQTVYNALLQPSLRWTGDRTSGAHQAERSLTGSLGFATAEAVVPLLREAGYGEAFRAAFPGAAEPLTPAHYAKAIEAYEATLITPAPFDRWMGGEDGALNAEQKTGLKAFLAAGCAGCHEGALLGGTSIRKFGLRKDYWTATGSEKVDAGLFDASKQEADRHKFRVSMLRNVARTAPYFHDGSVASLKDAVQVMAEVQGGARLGDAEAGAVAAFLESLSGGTPGHYAPPKAGGD